MPKKNDPMDTPAMRQYVEIKEKYPDSILFFRMGDFYEMFQEDAIKASALLDIALTKRQNKIPMCGFPYHATETYISRLIAANQKVVICEQVKNDPGSTSKLLTREVVRVITPGTVVEENLLKGFQNNYLCVYFIKDGFSFLGFADVSTSDLYYFSYPETELGKIISTIEKFKPREIAVFAEEANTLLQLLIENDSLITKIPKSALGKPEEQEKFAYLKQTIEYIINENFKNHSFEFKEPIIMDESEFLQIDEQSTRNLDLLENQTTRDKQFTLFAVLNKCTTGIGKRILANRILFPYQSKASIQSIWQKIEMLSTSKRILRSCYQQLSSFADLERILARFRTGKALPRDFRTIQRSILTAKKVQALLAEINYPFPFPEKELDKVYTFIEIRLSEKELPAILGGGELLRLGFDEKLDKAREAKTKGKDWILNLENQEKEKLGLNTLKIRYNKVVGYFLELSRAQAEHAPPHYNKKQTLVTSERFTFPELEEIERNILEADEIIVAIEKQEFEAMIATSLKFFHQFLILSREIGDLDFMISLCLCKDEYNWVKPEINDTGELQIIDGRHAVVEKYLPVGEKFVTNSVNLDPQKETIAILTGPNMAGKSTFMRQIALSQILFQMGSYVPAKSASFSIVDKLFTRIGSADNLTSGESTFFLEMKETANILKNKTPKSLILFDEIGRGTSTYDGMSIAWSIIEHLNLSAEKTKTIFATHYHELTELEREVGIFNLYMDTVEKDDSIIFMRKVKKGKARKSFGIYVARLAGIPEEVILRSREILIGLESKKKTIQFKSNEPSLFNIEALKQDSHTDSIVKTLQKMDINSMTPIEALQTLDNLQKQAKN
ncbi:MAG: DNA mismatch repair protein MutS [Spirochaetota bacterium]